MRPRTRPPAAESRRLWLPVMTRVRVRSARDSFMPRVPSASGACCSFTGSSEGWCAAGSGDEAHVGGGELPVAGVADQDEGGAGGLGDPVALVAAAGLVPGGDDHGPSVPAGL